MTKIRFFVVLFTAIAVYVAWGQYMSKVESPNYKVVGQKENVEFRIYPKIILAEVVIEEERKAAIKNGFKVLANYIFSNNIAMTAPVLQTKTANGWKISFIMPKKYQLNELPKSPEITLTATNFGKMAAIKFAGFSSDENLYKYEKIIRKALPDNKSPAIFAFYNPPWVIPFLRRNEVLIKYENKDR